jgi:hypothetical protein
MQASVQASPIRVVQQPTLMAQPVYQAPPVYHAPPVTMLRASPPAPPPIAYHEPMYHEPIYHEPMYHEPEPYYHEEYDRPYYPEEEYQEPAPAPQKLPQRAAPAPQKKAQRAFWDWGKKEEPEVKIVENIIEKEVLVPKIIEVRELVSVNL